ncbi:MAG TPA: SigE family RNA polymerase sigma factor [Frankiaceae bacterium]|jgi:RNA polymerase sigma-70 factor (sigma-E family)|nr:SigE family RNA polymerase sigma factor [Frankiaceae bacterium]
MSEEQDAAFVAFVEQHSRRLLRSAVLLTGRADAAEDLVQTALLRLYRHWPRVRDDDPLAYVRRVMVNARRDWWRRRTWSEQPVEAVPDVAAPDSAGGQAERDAVVRALAPLSRRERTVLVLRYCDDLPEREVAALLGVSQGTVKSTASRALAKVRLSPHLEVRP